MRAPRDPSTPLRVMVVEDDPLIADDLAATIEATAQPASLVVCRAASTPEALVGARETSPDVAFVDANLHDGRTGPELAELLDTHFGVVVVLAAGEIVHFQGASTRAVCVLPKPFTPEGVSESLRSAAREIDLRARRRTG